MLLSRLHEGLVSIRLVWKILQQSLALVRQSKFRVTFHHYIESRLSLVFFIKIICNQNQLHWQNFIATLLTPSLLSPCFPSHYWNTFLMFFQHFECLWDDMRWDVLQILSGKLVNYRCFAFWNKRCFLIWFCVQVLDLHLSYNLLIKAATLLKLRLPKDTSYFNVYILRSLTFSQSIHFKSLSKLFCFPQNWTWKLDIPCP